MDHASIEEVCTFLRQQIVNSQSRKIYLFLKIQKTTDERGSQQFSEKYINSYYWGNSNYFHMEKANSLFL